MAKDVAQTMTADQILDVTLSANTICADGEVNAYEIRNELVVEADKARVRYENGVTLPIHARALLQDVARKRRHSRILGRNLCRQSRQARPAKVEAHHIVACRDERANNARRLRFRWGIAINDADNGVFLPIAHHALEGFPGAVKHRSIHTARYFLEVDARLRPVAKEPSLKGRLELRGIRTELLEGTFPH